MFNFMPENHSTSVKAQSKHSNKWYVGYVWQGADKSYIIEGRLGVNVHKHKDGIHDELVAAVHEVKPETISLRSSCVDQGDKYLFAGDIVNFKFSSESEYSIGLVFFNGNEFSISEYKDGKKIIDWRLCDIPSKFIKTLGHICDKPELIAPPIQYSIVVEGGHKSSNDYAAFAIGCPDGKEESKELFKSYVKDSHRYKKPLSIKLLAVRVDAEGKALEEPFVISDYKENI